MTAPQPPVSVSSLSSNAHQQRFESTANATSLSPSLSPTAAAPASFTRRASDQSKAVNSDGQIALSDVQPPEGLGAVMVEHVRRKTGLSHDKSQLAVATVLNLLAERVPATENLVSAIQEDVTHQHVCACLLICTLQIFLILAYLVRKNQDSYLVLWYGDGAGNTAEENSSVFSLIRMHQLPSVL